MIVSGKKRSLSLHSGEIVRVRSENEIDRTLDEIGCLEGLPFMAEMRKYCGRDVKVLTHLERMLIEGVGYRQIRNTAILAEVTCDGSAHNGCNRTCPILWKEAWLERTGDATDDETISRLDKDSGRITLQGNSCSCQLLNLRKASRPPRSLEGFIQYLGSTEHGKRRLRRLIMLFHWLSSLTNRIGRTRPSVNTIRGSLKRTPVSCLDLNPGATVEVKSKEEIAATLDAKGRNRGLFFSPEMLRYCGRKYRVLKRIDRMLDEDTGRLRRIANTVILENVTCNGAFHEDCPRNCYCLWRETWLKRV